jgi:hypothetical protein
MIEIHEDKLRFTFPAIVAEIDSLLDAYVADLLPSFLAEDREAVIDQILDTHIERLDEPDFVNTVCNLTRELSPGQIGGLLRTQVQRERDRDEPHFTTGRADIVFQRTLRVPDDGGRYPLPPGVGRFPLRHVDDFAESVPAEWVQRGGVLMPMYQSEALWVGFVNAYPVAIKIAAGKVNAVSGGSWQAALQREPQDYVVSPGQPWLDGFAIAEGEVRQFVAMPLGGGYSAEEQLSGIAEFGGIQLQVIPMKARKYFESKLLPKLPRQLADVITKEVFARRRIFDTAVYGRACMKDDWYDGAMGLGAGGRIWQQIYKDPHAAEDWDLEQSGRCFVHLCNALQWRDITGERPPHVPFSVKDYQRSRLPWFDFYRDDLAVLEGSKTLAGIQSVNALHVEKHGWPLKGNASVKVPAVIDCGTGKKKTVVEWTGE